MRRWFWNRLERIVLGAIKSKRCSEIKSVNIAVLKINPKNIKRLSDHRWSVQGGIIRNIPFSHPCSRGNLQHAHRRTARIQYPSEQSD